jgi:phosphodiesterase/alkaline phosphatase D-like protein
MHGRGLRLGKGALVCLVLLAVLPWASTASGGSGPPEVATEPAQAVTKTTAKLTGTVNPKGLVVTSCEFKYGASQGSLNSSAACSPMPGPGSAPESVSAEVTALTPNTTYYFEIIATTEEGPNTPSEPLTSFKTLPNAPMVTTGSAKAKLTSAVLEGEVNPEGVAATCKFKYGTEAGSLTSTASCSPQPGSGTAFEAVTAQLTGLTPATTYHFQLEAEGEGGIVKGSEGEFTTPADELAVTTGEASERTMQSAKLSGTVNPGGSPVTSCEFEYGTTKGVLKSSVPCSALPGEGNTPVEVSATAKGLAPNTTYYFKLVAENEAGPAPVPAGEVAFTTFRNPPAVTTGAASGIGQTTATISGTVNPHGEPLKSCVVKYGTAPSLGSTAPCPSRPEGSSPVEVTIQLSALVPGTTYYYLVVAETAGGLEEDTNEVKSFTTAAATPPPGPSPSPPTGPTGPKGPEPARPPVVSSLSESNSVFRVGRSSTAPGGRISRTAATGTVFSFDLDQPAVVGITFIREESGHRIGKSCVVGRRGAGKPACVRSSVAMMLGRRARNGLNRLLFTGRVRGRALSPGAYRAVFIAESLAGSSTPSTISFRVVPH